MLAVKPPPTSSEVGLGRGRERECPCVLERVVRREGVFRLDESPSQPSPSMYPSDLVLASCRTIDPNLLQSGVTTSARPDFGLPVAESLHPNPNPPWPSGISSAPLWPKTAESNAVSFIM